MKWMPIWAYLAERKGEQMTNRLRLIKLLVRQMQVMDRLYVRLKQSGDFSNDEENKMLNEREEMVDRILRHLEELGCVREDA
jgi:hypothetical protein